MPVWGYWIPAFAGMTECGVAMTKRRGEVKIPLSPPLKKGEN